MAKVFLSRNTNSVPYWSCFAASLHPSNCAVDGEWNNKSSCLPLLGGSDLVGYDGAIWCHILAHYDPVRLVRLVSAQRRHFTLGPTCIEEFSEDAR